MLEVCSEKNKQQVDKLHPAEEKKASATRCGLWWSWSLSMGDSSERQLITLFYLFVAQYLGWRVFAQENLIKLYYKFKKGCVRLLSCTKAHGSTNHCGETQRKEIIFYLAQSVFRLTIPNVLILGGSSWLWAGHTISTREEWFKRRA